MKIYMKDDKICCTLENKNTKFLDKIFGFFAGFTEEGDLYSKFSKSEYLNNPLTDASQECDCFATFSELDNFMFYAKFYECEISEEVLEMFNSCKEKEEIVRKRWLAEAEERNARELWYYLKRFGCGRCEHLTYDVDVPMCNYCGKKLKDEPKGTWSASGKCYLMYGGNTVYPCEGCKFEK